MSSIIARIKKEELLLHRHMPKWLPENIHYETIVGSTAYGISNDSFDMDIYGFAIPPKSMVFPHVTGYISGFDPSPTTFEQFDPHHVYDPSKKRTYDLAIYGIIKYFKLCMHCNPNMIDSLFTPRRCVLFSTSIGEMVRENRKLFLHKRAWHPFKGYAYAQLSRLEKQNKSNPRRMEDIEKYGYDTKFACHIVRLLSEVEQIMVEHDLDLERNREQLKSIRRGEWSLDYLKKWFESKEHDLEKVYIKSTLIEEPRHNEIKQLLINCLEHHYGSIDNIIKTEENFTVRELIENINSVIGRYS